ncbi:MAG TPA: hypothetical protein VNF27_05600 [Candidatus Binataceae bacterium]|nr:hypothetical protein [Candidatus Binataceae bacterium]
MILPAGDYHYEIRRGAALVAIEEASFDGRRIAGARRFMDSANRYAVIADLAADSSIASVTLSYARGPFNRTAQYEAVGEFLRGQITAMAGRNAVTAKLGRFREIDADLVIFRALIIARVRARGQTRWTGRVAAIDPATLVAGSNKQSARCADGAGLRWIYEPRMGDREEIELDAAGRILRRLDDRGVEALLVDRRPG